MSRRSTNPGVLWLVVVAVIASHAAGSLCAIDCLTPAGSPQAGAPVSHHCATTAAPSDMTRMAGRDDACGEHATTVLEASGPGRPLHLTPPVGIHVLRRAPDVRPLAADRSAVSPHGHAPPGAPVPLRI